MKTYQNDNTNPKETPLVYYAGDKRQRDKFVKQTFDINGFQLAYKNIESISYVRLNGYNNTFYNYCIYIIGSNRDVAYYSENFSSPEDAEQSRNELIKQWNEVLNEI